MTDKSKTVFNFRAEAGFIRRVKVRCAELGVSMASVMRQLLEQWLGKVEK